MIIQFSCENYRSVMEKITLSMLATRDSEHEESLLKYNPKISLVPCVSIYGANGAGKTNVLNALGYISFLVKNCISFQDGDLLPFYPHKLNEKTLESSFEIQFISNNQRYAYGFSLNQERIIKEYLYRFPRNKQAKVFERVNDEYFFGDKYNKELSELKQKSKPYRLFISTAASWSECKEIVFPFKYLKDNLVVNMSTKNDNWLEYTLKEMQANIEKSMKGLQYNSEPSDVE